MKVLDKKVGDKTYYKYRINLPVEVVEKSGLLNKEIKVGFNKGKIVVEKEIKD